MSSVEIYGFKQDGDAKFYDEVENSWRGALKIWKLLERKYLPPIEVKDYLKGMYERLGTIPSRTESFLPDDGLREIWDLIESEKVSESDKAVLYTTLDRSVVLKKDIPNVIAALRSFSDETNLSEQADILERIYMDPEMMAVAWNQNSSNCESWDNYVYNGEDDDADNIPYNLFKNKEHFYLLEKEETHKYVILKKLNEILIEKGFIGAEAAYYTLPIGEDITAIIEVRSSNLQTELSWRLQIEHNEDTLKSDWFSLDEDSYIEMVNEEILNLI